MSPRTTPSIVETLMRGVASGWAGSTQPSSFPRFAAFETLQREQDLAGLTPKRGLIAAQPVEGIGRQIGEANKGAREVSALICRLYTNWCARIESDRGLVPGTIKVLARRQIETYSKLFHTVDHVEGMLRPGFDALDAFLTHAWAVTVTGAPKLLGYAVRRGS
jgi:hypothetical protein